MGPLHPMNPAGGLVRQSPFQIVEDKEYVNLQSDFDNLTNDYKILSANYDELNEDYESLLTEAKNTRNIMYSSIAVVIILLIASAYFFVKKQIKHCTRTHLARAI